MGSLGFTGTRRFARSDVPEIDPLIWEYFGAFDTFVTGGCIGFDAVIGWELAGRFPLAMHVVIVPADRSRVAPWWERRRLPTGAPVTVIEMAEGTSYRDRNIAIVKHSDALFYAADRPEDHPSQRRSGTWMTVRIARKARLPVIGMTLNKLKETQ